MKAETVGIFIDYANLLSSLKKSMIKGDIPYGKISHAKLRNFMCRQSILYYVFVYVGILKEESERLVEAMERQGFFAVTKPVKLIFLDEGILKKCNFDVEITLDIMDLHRLGRLPDRIVLVTGDSDFTSLVSWLKIYGYKVEVVSTYYALSTELKGAVMEGSKGKCYFFLEEIWEKVALC